MSRNWKLTAMAAIPLILLILVALRPYDFNPSALLRIGQGFGERHAVPSGIVLYEHGGYDGELYYQITRNIPQLIFGDNTNQIPFYNNAYRYQRILLPLSVWIVSLGQENFFPIVTIVINVIALLCALMLMAHAMKKWNVHTFTIIANPAALVGLLFSLTEPLNLALLAGFFVRWKQKKGAIDALQIVLLFLALLTRETTLFLIVLLGCIAVFRRQWRNTVMLTIPLILFGIWQMILYLRLGVIPMANGTVMIDPLYAGIPGLFSRAFENLNAYTLSSLALFILFVFPLFVWCIKRVIQKKDRSTLVFTLSGLLIIMGAMNVHLWGVITSIGRVVTPLFPVYALTAAENDSQVMRRLSASLMIVSIIAAVGIALQSHSFIIS